MLLPKPMAPGQALPGLGAADPRVPVDISTPPWSAVVLVQIPGVGRCTGFLIDSRTVLTAAHCLFEPRVRHLAPPDSVHVLTGYQRGRFSGHTVVASYRTGAGWTMLDEGHSFGADAAALTLASPLGDATLALLPALPGTAAMLGGFERDRAQILLADTACRVMGTVADPQGRTLRQYSCAGTSGTSGAPLLVRATGGGWAAAGLQIAATDGAAGGLAVPVETLAALLASK